MAEAITIGKPEIRKDAWAKVTGAAEYVDDIALPGVLVGMCVRSPHHHARIVSIDTGAAQAIPGVVAVLTSADVPGDKTSGPLVQDQLSLFLCMRTDTISFSSSKLTSNAIRLTFPSKERSGSIERSASRASFEADLTSEGLLLMFDSF